jgi:hypothetical protein
MSRGDKVKAEVLRDFSYRRTPIRSKTKDCMRPGWEVTFKGQPVVVLDTLARVKQFIYRKATT